MNGSVLAGLAAAGLFAAAPAPVLALTGGGCQPISAVPFTVVAPGTYCLTGDTAYLPHQGAAILVKADNVVIDLSSFSLTGPGAVPDNKAIGIAADNRKNVRIFGGAGALAGTIKGFEYGVLIADSTAGWEDGSSAGHVVARVSVVGSRACGICLTGNNSAILDDSVSGTTSPGPFAAGISVTGNRNTLRGNTVTATRARAPGGFAAGISLNYGNQMSVSQNAVRRVTGPGERHGFRCGHPFQIPSFDNTVTGATIRFSTCKATARRVTGYPYPGPIPYPYPYPYPFSEQSAWLGVAFGALLALGAAVLKWTASVA